MRSPASSPLLILPRPVSARAIESSPPASNCFGKSAFGFPRVADGGEVL